MSETRNTSQWQRSIYVIVMLLFAFNAFRAQAQDEASKQPHAMAIASPKGIWIFLGPSIPKSEAYQVFRASGDPKPLARSSAPSSREELANRIRHYAPYFKGLAPVDSSGIDRLWNYLQTHDEVTELPAWNIPVSHLALGTAVLDTTATAAKDDTNFRYRIQLGSATEETNRATWPAHSSLPAPKRLKGAQESFDGSRVHLQWLVPVDAEPAGILIRRRNKMQGEFEPISAISGFHALRSSVYAVGRDDQVVRNSVYEYTASLVDYFANPGPPSQPITVSTFPTGSVPTVAS